MANIRNIRNKSYGTIRTISTKLQELNLRKYYFECGMLFLNLMLRSSILYGSETYYNLKIRGPGENRRIVYETISWDN